MDAGERPGEKDNLFTIKWQWACRVAFPGMLERLKGEGSPIVTGPRHLIELARLMESKPSLKLEFLGNQTG